VRTSHSLSTPFNLQYECFHQTMSFYNEKMLTQWVPAGADAVKSVEDAVTGAFQYVKFAYLL
jgi:hypothetical protein